MSGTARHSPCYLPSLVGVPLPASWLSGNSNMRPENGSQNTAGHSPTHPTDWPICGASATYKWCKSTGLQFILAHMDRGFSHPANYVNNVRPSVDITATVRIRPMPRVIVMRRGKELPPHTKAVDRRSKSGNPFIAGRDGPGAEDVVRMFACHLLSQLKLEPR